MHIQHISMCEGSHQVILPIVGGQIHILYFLQIWASASACLRIIYSEDKREHKQ